MAFFSSCKKTNDTTTDPEIETTVQLTADQGDADDLSEDDNDVLMEMAQENSLTGNFTADPVVGNNLLQCATVTITPANSFPKTIVIDFGPTNCVSPNGVAHRGKVQIVLSDSLRRPGSTAVMTFDNYYVNDYKREGTHTWTNTSTADIKSWQRKVENGKITAPDGRFWLHTSIRTVTQVAGYNTPRILLDDEFTIRGTSSTTNPANVTRTATITEPLHKKYICRHIDQGRVRFEGPNHYAVLDYGNGDCDRIATISVDGGTPRTIILHR
jgi:hypothetical protein